MKELRPPMSTDKRRLKTWFLSAFICLNLRLDLVASAAPLPLMPMPVKVETASGALPIDSNFTIAVSGYSDARLESAIKRFTARLAKQTGLPIPLPNVPGRDRESALSR